MFKTSLSISLIAGLAAGCAVGPDYARPDAPLPQHYFSKEAIEQRGSAATVPSSAWWEGFDDPNLNRLVALALRQNLDIGQAAARITQAKAGLASANAALLPSASVSAQGTRAHQSLETPLGQVLSSTPGYDRNGSAYDVSLGASWELDLFGGVRRDREAALAEYQASQAGAAAVQLAVAAQTADLYMTIRGLQIRLDVAGRQIQTQQELLAKIRQLYDQGLAAELQMRQTEGALAQVRATVPVLQAALDAAMNAMDVMLGSAPGTHRQELAEARGVLPAIPQVAATGSPRDLLRRRPDLVVAERRLAASNARIGAATAEYYPKLSLSGMLGSATAISAGKLFSGSANQAAGILGLRWRLFDFARINAQIEVAKGREAEALAAYRLSALHAMEDVENAFSTLVNREQQASILADGVNSLGRARAASLAAYQQGVASLVEVLQADENLLRATDTQAQAQTESARAAVAAFKALGG
ncbi:MULTISPECIES: efflux transporter outer membrane subunit [unclassified Duganella]|uniref:efflux transporter outer membrane subunit n=1 Tax=unclassified Duganella TaxID=2636909 RepID=UPI0006FD9633|nr:MULTISPECIES: efflux transporter outer membrane subunit [unclassified Duganella]KQV61520.1 RND transporter [Duganella sp. Root336D2]KRB92389.1 RND transporter [Duganella sp. Root198D2]